MTPAEYLAAVSVRDCAAAAFGLGLGLVVMLAAVAVVPRRMEVLVRRDAAAARWKALAEQTADCLARFVVQHGHQVGPPLRGPNVDGDAKEGP